MWIEERDGKYKYNERYIDELTGKTKKVTITLEKKNDKLALNLLTAKIDAANRRTDYSDMTFRELTERYLEDRKGSVKGATHRKSLSMCKTFNEMIGPDTRIQKLTSAFLRDALEKSTKDNGTRNERLVRLKALLHWGYEKEFLSDISYLSRLKRYPDPKKKEKLQEKFLEASEVTTLMNHIADNKCKHWVYLSRFLLLSGLRVGEALALTWKDLTDDYITVDKTYSLITLKIEDTPKTDASNRDVYMQQELKSVVQDIKAYKRLRKVACLYLFSNSAGSIVDYSSYRKWLARQSRAAIGRKITPHIFRHTHCSLLIAAGESLDAVARRLGHIDSNITKEIYLHYTEQIKENDRRRLDQIRMLG